MVTDNRQQPQFLVQHAAGRDWRVTSTGFWQVHPAAADTLVTAVLAGLAPKPGETALDLFCGAGLFAGALADAVGPDGTVVAVEQDQDAVRDARRNLRDTPGRGCIAAMRPRWSAGTGYPVRRSRSSTRREQALASR